MKQRKHLVPQSMVQVRNVIFSKQSKAQKGKVTVANWQRHKFNSERHFSACFRLPQTDFREFDMHF